MSRNMLVLFLLVAVVCATVMSNPPPKNPKCGKNEELVKCPPKPECQPSCKNLNPGCHKMKHHKCSAACVCKHGLVRNNKGECIRKCECDC